MADKKLIATTVSSREKGIRRREEGETTSSQRKISTQGNQDSSKKNHMKAEDESPTQRRNCKNDNDDEAKRMEDMRSRGGGRLKHCIVDGDVPLCLRRNLRDSKEASRTRMPIDDSDSVVPNCALGQQVIPTDLNSAEERVDTTSTNHR